MEYFIGRLELEQAVIQDRKVGWLFYFTLL